MTRPQSDFSLPESSNRRGRGRAKDKTSARGYGNEHQKLRKRLTPAVRAGRVSCWRCGEVIVPDLTIPGEGWDLGHDDNDRSQYKGPEHAGCNRSTSGRRTMRWQSREW